MCSISNALRRSKPAGGFLDDLVGQDLVKKTLRKAVALGSVSHAYLFYGPDGTGKSLAALELARALNCCCADAKPCRRCESCSSAESETNPDLTVVRPSGSSFKIDEARMFIDQIHFRPIRYHYRIHVLLHAELLTPEAANALLKTLEDPPGAAVTIMTASSVENLPLTLLSRCQQLCFKPVSHQEILSFIKSITATMEEMSDDQVNAIAALSEGIPGNVMEMLQEGDFRQVRAQCMDMLQKAVDGKDALAGLVDFPEDSGKYEEIIKISISLLRDLIIAKTDRGHGLLVHRDLTQALTALSRKCSWEGLLTVFREMLDADYALRKNANAHMLVSALGIKLRRGLGKIDL